MFDKSLKRLKRKQGKRVVMDTKKPTAQESGELLKTITKAVEKAGGDTGEDTVLGVLNKGKENFEAIRKEYQKRVEE